MEDSNPTKELVVYGDEDILNRITSAHCVNCIVRVMCVYKSFYITDNNVKQHYLNVSKPCNSIMDLAEHLSKIGIIGPRVDVESTINGAFIYQVTKTVYRR